MNFKTMFESWPTCPSCFGARPLTQQGLCETCSREYSAGRLTEYRNRHREEEIVTEPNTIAADVLPALYKRTATGAVQVWTIRVEPQDDGTAVIITRHGQLDGAQQEARDHVRHGKNPGRRNATTPFQQAVAEATSKWNKQRDRNHYGLDVGESEAKKFLAPMLAHRFTDSKGRLTSDAKKVDWSNSQHLHVQPKFDGHRCLAIREDGPVRLFTKKGVEVMSCPHLVEQLSSVMPIRTALDGELYTHGVPVTTIGGYITKQQAGSEQLCFMAYDIVLRETPFTQRFAELFRLVGGKGTHLQLARTHNISSFDAAMGFMEECVAHGFEGAVLRHGLAGYAAGKRSASLLKLKSFVDGEYTIVGCKEGRGGYEGVAIFECVTLAGHKFDVTAPGSIPEKQAIWQNRQAYIGRQLTVKYQRFTETDEPVPFQPVAKGFRE